VALGDRSLLLGNPLSLDSRAITSDVAEFRARLEAGELDDAVALYRGPFLDGFYLAGVPEFEQWIETERGRLAQQYAAALEQLADAATGRGDRQRAVSFLRSLGDLEPLNSRVSIRLMEALAAVGDRSAALHVGSLYGSRIRAELGVDPDVEVTNLIARIRRTEAHERRDDSVSEAPAMTSTRRGRPATRAVPFAIAAILIGAAGGAAWRFASNARETQLKAVAVLPCEDVSRDPNEARLGDRWAEELIHKLFLLRDLRPRAWQSVQRYRDATVSAARIRDELNAGAFVRCRVAEQSDSVRLTLELLRTDNEDLIWSGVYSRPAKADAVNAIQSAAALDIARTLGAMGDRQSASIITRPMTRDSTALRLYRMGQYLLETRGFAPELTRAIEYFRRAIERDSAFAHAYVSLADALMFLSSSEALQTSQHYPEVGALLLRAVQLDPLLAEAHTMLGGYLLDYTYDWIGAEREHRRAVELNPSSREAHLWLGHHLLIAERLNEAIAQFERAVDLDPVSFFARGHLARALVLAGDDQRAEREIQIGMDLAPTWHPFLHNLAFILLRRGMRDSAAAVLERADEVTIPDAPLYVAIGKRHVAQRLLDSLTSLDKRPDLGYLAMVQLALGHKDAAIRSLEQAYAERSGTLPFFLSQAPYMDSLRAEPRFGALRARVGFTR
jgi:serine/threonine-protein kinase